MPYDTVEDLFPIRHTLFAGSPCKVDFCHFLRGTFTWNRRNLAASHWRLYWNPTGDAAIHYKDQTVALDSTTVALIPPGVAFSKSATTFVEHFHIHFTTSPDIDRSLGGMLHRIDATDAATSMMREIIALLNDNRESSILYQMTIVNVVAWALLEVSHRFPDASVEDRRLNDVCTYMNDHTGEQIENASLAKIAGMNKNAFVRFFRKATGQTPQRYMMGKRIHMAGMLLSGSDLTIDRIAERVGYSDRNRFTTVFTRETKISPAAYRKQRGQAGG